MAMLNCSDLYACATAPSFPWAFCKYLYSNGCGNTNPNLATAVPNCCEGPCSLSTVLLQGCGILADRLRILNRAESILDRAPFTCTYPEQLRFLAACYRILHQSRCHSGSCSRSLKNASKKGRFGTQISAKSNSVLGRVLKTVQNGDRGFSCTTTLATATVVDLSTSLQFTCVN